MLGGIGRPSVEIGPERGDDRPCKHPGRGCLEPYLGQLGLTYRVQSGYVRIIPNAYQPLPFEEDPVMIAGHSLLALVAAVFGGRGPFPARRR